MTDRELLELAAKAAGMVPSHDCWEDPPRLVWIAKSGSGMIATWAPLTDDGDALRLAVKLGFTVSWDVYNDDNYATATPPNTYQGYDCVIGQDPYAATRRAIVRAAAEIGRTKP